MAASSREGLRAAFEHAEQREADLLIENARLFSELQASTRTLSEAIEQQAATADVLRAIASAPGDLPSVLDTIVRSAAHCRNLTGTPYVARTTLSSASGSAAAPGSSQASAASVSDPWGTFPGPRLTAA